MASTPVLSAQIPWAALVPILVLAIAFEVYCLVDLAGAEVRYLPKWVWGLLILVSNPIGGVAYLLLGRSAS
jgi:hypothetical protein